MVRYLCGMTTAKTRFMPAMFVRRAHSRRAPSQPEHTLWRRKISRRGRRPDCCANGARSGSTRVGHALAVRRQLACLNGAGDHDVSVGEGLDAYESPVLPPIVPGLAKIRLPREPVDKLQMQAAKIA
jgi:hypothetical protein